MTRLYLNSMDHGEAKLRRWISIIDAGVNSLFLNKDNPRHRTFNRR
jgi:hypothetical protein